MSIGKRQRFEPNCPPGGSQRRHVLDPVLWRLKKRLTDPRETSVSEREPQRWVCAQKRPRAKAGPGPRPRRLEAARRRETRVPVPTRAPAAAATVLPTPTCREAVSGCFLLTPALGAHTRVQQVGRSRACDTRRSGLSRRVGGVQTHLAFRRATRAASHRLPRDADKSHHTETAAPRGACGGPGVGLNAAEGHHGSPSSGSPQVAAAEAARGVRV